MHSGIHVVHEGKRGCGFRKTGGLYLVGNGTSFDCGRLPIPLMTCPCCGHGFKVSRGWTWVDADRLIEAAPECLRKKSACRLCPMDRMIRDGIGRAGLIWIGEEFYQTTADFNREAEAMGVSRRLHTVPHGFVVGETWVLLAHRKAILREAPRMGEKPQWIPGIFRLFKPERIEVIVKGDEPDSVIDGYIDRGLTPVKIVRTDDGEQPSLAEHLFKAAVNGEESGDA